MLVTFEVYVNTLYNVCTIHLSGILLLSPNHCLDWHSSDSQHNNHDHTHRSSYLCLYNNKHPEIYRLKNYDFILFSQ